MPSTWELHFVASSASCVDLFIGTEKIQIYVCTYVITLLELCKFSTFVQLRSLEFSLHLFSSVAFVLVYSVSIFVYSVSRSVYYVYRYMKIRVDVERKIYELNTYLGDVIVAKI